MQSDDPARDRAPAACGIAVMAKASKPGRTKTRLAAVVGAATAAALNTAFLEDIAANLTAARAVAPIAGYFAFGPPEEIDFFAFLPPDIACLEAWEPSFGETLKTALRRLFANGHGAACVLNADSPTLPTSILAEAARVLAEPGDRIVLGPSNDGGYYLLGMTRAHAPLYAGISWSTERVAAQTRGAAARVGVPLRELPAWYDVDDRAALDRLLADLEAGTGYPAPATAACVARLRLAERLRA